MRKFPDLRYGLFISFDVTSGLTRLLNKVGGNTPYDTFPSDQFDRGWNQMMYGN